MSLLKSNSWACVAPTAGTIGNLLLLLSGTVQASGQGAALALAGASVEGLSAWEAWAQVGGGT